MKDKTPLYHYPASYAQEHGEFEQYQASFQSNIACRKAIEKAINDHYCDYILGDNKLWAQTISVFHDKDGSSFDRNTYFVVDRAHPGLVNIFLSMVRREYERSQEKKTSVHESLNKQQTKKLTEQTPRQRKMPER